MAVGNDTVNSLWSRAGSNVSSPFASLSRSLFPRTVAEVFCWAEELWVHQGVYPTAISKAVRYFLTELLITGEDVSYKERVKSQEMLASTFDVKGEAGSVGDDFVAFGNSFTSVQVPFVRELCCPCGFKAPLKRLFKEQYVTWSGQGFTGRCPVCKRNGAWTHNDFRLLGAEAKPVIVRWPLQYMKIKWHPISQTGEYRLDLKRYSELSGPIKKGDPLFLAETPWEIIDAVVNDKEFTFAEDEIYHMRNRSAAHLMPKLQGWGLPKFLCEFDTVVMLIMLDKFNECILNDYLIPFRVIAPPQRSDTQLDPLSSIGAQEFVPKIKAMLNNHRRNPTGWHVLPFPLEYQKLGGEAKDLSPVEFQQHYEERLLHCMSIPEAFSDQAVGANAQPIIDFKMFERFWQHFGYEINQWLTWVSNKVGALESWERVEVSFIKASVYEDPQIIAAKGELAAAGKCSNTTFFKSLEMDYMYEMRRVLEEEDELAELSEERRREMDNTQGNLMAVQTPSPGMQQMQAEQEAAGGAPGGAGPAPMQSPMAAVPPVPDDSTLTLDDLQVQADEYAQQLLYADTATRRRVLSSLKHQNETLYAQVKAKLSDLEQLGRTRGVQMLRAGQMPL